MLEEFGDQSLGKLVFVEDNERITLLRPSDELLIFPLLEKTIFVSA